MNNGTKWFGLNPLIVIAIALLALSQCFVIIEPGYAGVSVILGRANTQYLANGIHFKLPFIEAINIIRTKQTTVAGEAECFSSDLQTVKISFNALFRTPEERAVDLFTNYRGDRAYEELLYPRIQDSIKQVAALYRAEDLVKSRDKVKLQAARLVRKSLRVKKGYDIDDVFVLERKQQALEMVLDRLPSDSPERKAINAQLLALGQESNKMLNTTALVELVDLPISNIDLTDELEKAIEQKQIKEQEALAKRYELEKAKRDAEITIVNAQAEAKSVQIKGAALRSAPAVIDLEIAKKWDGKSPTTVVVGRGGSNVLLPLK